MKILNYVGEQYKGSKVLKSDNSITVLDDKGIEVFTAKGISDFSQYSLEEGQVFDIELTIEERMSLIQKAMDDLTLGGTL